MTWLGPRLERAVDSERRPGLDGADVSMDLLG
jgi:hypothetical protein